MMRVSPERGDPVFLQNQCECMVIAFLIQNAAGGGRDSRRV